MYAIVDEQSNSSLVSSKVADKLGANGPPEEYYLSTCSSEKEEKYGRVTDFVVRSLNGGESALIPLVECDNIP